MTLTPSTIPLEAALQQQICQERLLSQVIAQIRQSLELPVILETTVTEVRQFLQVDRLVIYQFIDTSFVTINPPKGRNNYGQITYESRISDNIPTVLELTTENDCFTDIPQYLEKYLNGQVIAINEVEKAYSSSYCLINFLQKYQIAAKLIAPILVQGKVWGLLIAHQCFRPRQWQENEVNFLRQIGEHLAVAIYQAQLYAEVQHQKNTFEKRVIERTQELGDTLLASQSASRLRSEFIDNISHELRTPLTCVIGLSGTLLHWFKQEKSLPIEKQQLYLKMIQDSGKKLMELINGIIELSQLESGKSALNFQVFSVLNLAQNVLRELEPIAQKKDVNLKLDFQINSNKNKLYADPDRIQQILFHLLGNGIKFTPEKGTVILRIWEEDNQIVFQVEDTGVGIAKDQFPFLFEAFKQVENTRQRTYEGSGLGLALTKQLVELHSGRIQVESIKGKGSAFTIFIPIQNPDQQKNTPSSISQESQLLLNAGIVVLERNEEIATLICELLTAAGYQVIWLIDSSTAIKQIELLQPGIVLVDQDFDDFRYLGRTLKNSRKIKSLKVVLLSEGISSVQWETFRKSGIDDFLIKPLQPDVILQKLSAFTFSSIQLEEEDINSDLQSETNQNI
ncbi:MAG: ATP-binding protein [Snowella sp.]|nr:ATP-binding protein [Snowella sp.]